LKANLHPLIIVLSALVLRLHAESWVFTDGTRLEAEVKVVTPGLVVFSGTAGKDLAVETGKLSEASRRRLAELLGLTTVIMDAPAGTPAPTVQRKAQIEPGAMDATDLDLIDSQFGKTGAVTGVVKEVISLGSLGHRKLVFEGTDFSVFISKRWLEQNPGWRIDDFIGKRVRVTGEISKYEDQLQISLKEPSQLVELK